MMIFCSSRFNSYDPYDSYTPRRQQQHKQQQQENQKQQQQQQQHNLSATAQPSPIIRSTLLPFVSSSLSLSLSMLVWSCKYFLRYKIVIKILLMMMMMMMMMTTTTTSIATAFVVPKQQVQQQQRRQRQILSQFQSFGLRQQQQQQQQQHGSLSSSSLSLLSVPSSFIKQRHRIVNPWTLSSLLSSAPAPFCPWFPRYTDRCFGSSSLSLLLLVPHSDSLRLRTRTRTTATTYPKRRTDGTTFVLRSSSSSSSTSINNNNNHSNDYDTNTTTTTASSSTSSGIEELSNFATSTIENTIQTEALLQSSSSQQILQQQLLARTNNIDSVNTVYNNNNNNDEDNIGNNNDNNTSKKRFLSRKELIALGRDTFQSIYNFPLDDWQCEAGGAIVSGYNVIVGSPTGSGKTVVGEMALYYAYVLCNANGIYTTPLKALSNQKYTDLVTFYSTFYNTNTTTPDSIINTNTLIGLSTGDVSINKQTARLTVMTTEVYRNIAWRYTSGSSSSTTNVGNASSAAGTYNDDDTSSIIIGTDELDPVRVVVLDEFHYMGHPGRGGVWEEAVITTPSYHIQLIGLSATLSNAKEIVAWMESVTNRTTYLIQVPDDRRPVPLQYIYATKDGFYPLFRDPQAGPGSIKGLLGYQPNNPNNLFYDDDDNYNDDDDLPSSKQKRGGGKGFVASATATDKSVSKLPRGLQVNPTLKKITEQRMQKVLRELEKQQQQLSSPSRRRNKWEDWDTDFEDELYSDNSNRRGKRPSNAIPIKLTPKQYQKEKERLLKKELRRSVPTIHWVVSKLYSQQLVPVIVFLFSRNGCDDAAANLCRYRKGPSRNPFKDDDFLNEIDTFVVDDTKGIKKDKNGRSYRASFGGPSSKAKPPPTLPSTSLYEDTSSGDEGNESDVTRPIDHKNGKSSFDPSNWEYYSKVGFLGTYERVQMVATKVANFNRDNPELAFPSNIMEQFMMGIGTHHAGMVPAHKSFVETLFKQQFIQVVFATETLAAGINMPARTTVLCSMAKPGGSSSSANSNQGPVMSLLATHNLLQMAGRAGRRGMDTSGTCVLLATPFENADTAVEILTNPILPIQSQFKPSYSLCINLVLRGNGKFDIAYQLVSKSFAMWQNQQQKRRQYIDQQSQLTQSILNDTGLISTTGTNNEWLVDEQDERDDELFQIAREAQLVERLVEILERKVAQRSAIVPITRIENILPILQNRDQLKASSKLYSALSQQYDREQTTVEYLKKELRTLRESSLSSIDNNNNNEEGDDEVSRMILNEMLVEDEQNIIEQLEMQQNRLKECGVQCKRHPFTVITSLVNQLLSNDNDSDAKMLRSSLQLARGGTVTKQLRSHDSDDERDSETESDDDDDVDDNSDKELDPVELSQYAKSYIRFDRKAKKKALRKASDSTELDRILQQTNEFDTTQPGSTRNNDDAINFVDSEDSWKEFLAITKTLVAYGCLLIKEEEEGRTTATEAIRFRPSDMTIDFNTTVAVTPAGINVGMLGLENSLWVLVAMGGAWDVIGASSRLDRSTRNDDNYYSTVDEENQPNTGSTQQHGIIPLAQTENDELVELLRNMSPSEMAGYVSSIVSEESRSFSLSVVEQFKQLTAVQQTVTQKAFTALDRFTEVQQLYSVDGSTTRTCTIDLSTCQVVTEWAAGCSWNEALEISGLPPGDLIRTLSRALDALRQVGNLPYTPVRRRQEDGRIIIPNGIHPDIRRTCRDAAKIINRYPLKDQFSLAIDDEDEEDDDDNIDNNLELVLETNVLGSTDQATKEI